jgi:hypothetical protein
MCFGAKERKAAEEGAYRKQQEEERGRGGRRYQTGDTGNVHGDTAGNSFTNSTYRNSYDDRNQNRYHGNRFGGGGGSGQNYYKDRDAREFTDHDSRPNSPEDQDNSTVYGRQRMEIGAVGAEDQFSRGGRSASNGQDTANHNISPKDIELGVQGTGNDTGYIDEPGDNNKSPTTANADSILDAKTDTSPVPSSLMDAASPGRFASPDLSKPQFEFGNEPPRSTANDNTAHMTPPLNNQNNNESTMSGTKKTSTTTKSMTTAAPTKTMTTMVSTKPTSLQVPAKLKAQSGPGSLSLGIALANRHIAEDEDIFGDIGDIANLSSHPSIVSSQRSIFSESGTVRGD